MSHDPRTEGSVQPARPEYLDVEPIAWVEGEVALPGSKSISNRTLLLAALAGGETVIRGLLAADDIDRMLEALTALGVEIRTCDATGEVTVRGTGGEIPQRAAKLFLGNAGTAFRPLTAVLALMGGDYELSGVPRMHERPIKDLVDALRALGADVNYLGNDGYPPLAIGPGSVDGSCGNCVAVRGDVSSQFLSALLMAAPLLTARTSQPIVIDVVGELISRPYVAITTNLMRRFGVTVVEEGTQRFVVPANARYTSPGLIHVEGDASGASYFLAAGAIAGPLRVTGIGRNSIQGDVAFAAELERMGAVIEFTDDAITARPGIQLTARTIDCVAIPDAAMTFAVLALFAHGTTTLTGIASWRVKETDRIAAMAAELRKLGATVESGDDFLRVTPPTRLTPATIDTYDDHRIAMCFSLAALGGVRVRINDPACVRKTYPEYFDELARIARHSPPPVIAVDGPAASGKGTIAAGVARALGFRMLDSGALYRLVALKSQRAGLAPDDEAGIAGLAAALDVEFDGDCVWLDRGDVTGAIRAEAISALASKVSALPAVRSALFDRQRAFRQPPGLVADGRDMGTVVFPEAKLKLFVTATAEERARRRYKQLIEKGNSVTLDSLLREIRERDERDAGRAVAPLKPAADAVLLDTTQMTIDAAIAFVLARWREASSGETKRS